MAMPMFRSTRSSVTRVSKKTAEDIPVIAFSVGEEELSGIDTAPLVGHLAAWNYFMSAESETNDEFIETWQSFIKDEDRVSNDPIVADWSAPVQCGNYNLATGVCSGQNY